VNFRTNCPRKSCGSVGCVVSWSLRVHVLVLLMRIAVLTSLPMRYDTIL